MWGCLVKLRETSQLTWGGLAFEPQPGSSLVPQALDAEDGIRSPSPQGHPAAAVIIPSCLGIPGSQEGFCHHSLYLVALPGLLGSAKASCLPGNVVDPVKQAGAAVNPLGWRSKALPVHPEQ